MPKGKGYISSVTKTKPSVSKSRTKKSSSARGKKK